MMRKKRGQALQRVVPQAKSLFRDRSGNVAMLFGLAMVPVLGGIGAALDYSRASATRSDLQSAVDSASLAGARQLPKGEDQVKAAVAAFMAANLPPEFKGSPYSVKVDIKEKLVRVEMTANVPSTVMKVIGKDKMPVSVYSQAVSGIDRTEVVLALDTTGTMRNHMASLREGASEIVNLLFAAAVSKDDVRVAMVPYVAQVNIGSHPSRMSWMDTNANARHHGENFRNFSLKDRRCDPPPPPPPPPPIVQAPTNPAGIPLPPHAKGNPPQNNNNNPSPPSAPKPPKPPKAKPWSPDLGSLDLPGHETGMRFAGYSGADVQAGIDFLLSALGPSKAHAQAAWPYGTLDDSTPIDCSRTTPIRVNHFDLFNAMNVRWKGCVEARPSPYDVDLTPPTSANPDTLFVPYLWPDESDNHDGDVRNNYLSDTAGMPSWLKDTGSSELRQSFIWKYRFGGSPNVDDTSFLTRGPNAACPDPIVPLTNKKKELDNAISSLRAYAASGTNIAEGMAWAWRVISPGQPFDDAAPYDKKNKKFVVLMTDGVNEVVPQGVDWNKSDYSAIGYAAKSRLGTSDRTEITTKLDDKLTTVCDSMKGQDIQIFTILYDPVGYTSNASITNRLQSCATKPQFSFRVVTQGDLVQAFRTIGGEITKLRINR